MKNAGFVKKVDFFKVHVLLLDESNQSINPSLKRKIITKPEVSPGSFFFKVCSYEVAPSPPSGVVICFLLFFIVVKRVLMIGLNVNRKRIITHYILG